jgi:hypothetical protein
VKLFTVNPVIYTFASVKNQISGNNINGTEILKKESILTGDKNYIFIAKLNYENLGRFDPPMNLNVFPKYVSEEVKRNVKKYFYFIFLAILE